MVADVGGAGSATGVRLDVRLHRAHGMEALGVEVDHLVIAGWTGREPASLDRHIIELARMGVAPPPSTPVFYRASASLLTQAQRFQVVGPDSSGEGEFFLLGSAAGTLVGVGSDHTDRKVEAYDITVSKQMCPKPVGSSVWLLSDVREQWDTLLLETHVTRNGKRTLYQRGALSALLSPDDLVRRYAGAGSLPVGTLIFGGTLPAIGEIAGGERFEIALVDQASARRLAHRYDVDVLPAFEPR